MKTVRAFSRHDESVQKRSPSAQPQTTGIVPAVMVLHFNTVFCNNIKSAMRYFFCRSEGRHPYGRGSFSGILPQPRKKICQILIVFLTLYARPAPSVLQNFFQIFSYLSKSADDILSERKKDGWCRESFTRIKLLAGRSFGSAPLVQSILINLII